MNKVAHGAAPLQFPETLIRALKNDDIAATAVAYVEWGFPVVPLAPGEKRPHSDFAPNGTLSAITDLHQAAQTFYASNCGLGILAGESYVVLDFDPRHGSRPDGLIGLPATNFERTPSGGEHLLFRMPLGQRARTFKPYPGLDVLAGTQNIVVAGTVLDDGRRYWNPDPAAQIAEMPIEWWLRYAHDAGSEQKSIRLNRMRWTPQLRFEAERLVTKAMHSDFGAAYQAIARGEWQSLSCIDGTQRYPSESEADLGLAREFAYWTREPDEIDRAVIAAFERGGYRRSKWIERPDYAAMTIEKAIAWHENGNISRRHASSPLDRFTFSDSDDATGVLVAQSGSTGSQERTKGSKRERLVRELLWLAERSGGDADGWQRVPINEYAQHFGVHRNSVANAIQEAVTGGLLETRIESRRTSRIRYVRLAS